mgnify:CR=1 FL=1
MNITIYVGKEYADVMEFLVKSGIYKSKSELVREAISLLISRHMEQGNLPPITKDFLKNTRNQELKQSMQRRHRIRI